MEYDIVVVDMDNKESFNTFLINTNQSLENAQGLILTGEADITPATELIKDFKSQETALNKYKKALVKIAGIAVVDDESAKRQDLRLKIERQVKDIKQEIKEKATDSFVKSFEVLLSSSKASTAYKKSIGYPYTIALEQIKGKSKNLSKILNIELELIKSGLDKNAIETEKKRDVIKKYDDTLTMDTDNLLNHSIDELIYLLEARLSNYQEKIKREAQSQQEKIKREEQERVERTNRDIQTQNDKEHEQAQNAVDLGKKHDIQEAIRQTDKKIKRERYTLNLVVEILGNLDTVKEIANSYNNGICIYDQNQTTVNTISALNLKKDD